MGTKNIHAVFPKEYKDVLLEGLTEQGYNIVNYDNSFDTFFHWSNSEEETIADLALIGETLKDDLPIEVMLQEFIVKLKEIRFNRPTLRLVIFLPTQAKFISNFKEEMIKLAVYDFYFADTFSFDSLIEWIENPKNLGDMKQYLINDSSTSPELVMTEEKVKEKEVEQDIKGAETEPPKEINSRIARTQQKQKVKTVYEEKIIERVVTIQAKKIAIHSLSRGAGSTFHTLNLGAYFQEKNVSVGIYENPLNQEGKTYHADALSLFEKKDTLISVADQISKKFPIFKDQIPSYQDIRCYALNSDKDNIDHFSYDNFLRYLNVGTETVKLMDFGYLPTDILNQDWNDLFSQFDLHILCVDIMPTSLIPNYDRLSFYLNEVLNIPVSILINKHVKSIQKEDLEDIGINEFLICPHLNHDIIFDAFYYNKIPYQSNTLIKEALDPIYNQYKDKVGLDTLHDGKPKKRWTNFFSK